MFVKQLKIFLSKYSNQAGYVTWPVTYSCFNWTIYLWAWTK